MRATLKAEQCAKATDQARRKAVGLSHSSTTSSKLPMLAMLLLKEDMYHEGGLQGLAALTCCESTKTSIHSIASAASLRPSKKIKIASSVLAKDVLHVWLMNHVAAPTRCAVAACDDSSSMTLQRRRAVRGRRYIFSNCDVVRRWSEGPNSTLSQRK